MLRCLFIRHKLYDYLENSLSELDKIKVENHLGICNNCKERLGQIRSILDLASQRKSPQPNSEFWHNFKLELDRRLNENLIPPITFERRLVYRLRPAFAYIFILIFFLTIGNYLYKRPFSRLPNIAQDEDLIDETLTLDELEEGLESEHNEDAYTEELDLFYQLDQI